MKQQHKKGHCFFTATKHLFLAVCVPVSLHLGMKRSELTTPDLKCHTCIPHPIATHTPLCPSISMHFDAVLQIASQFFHFPHLSIQCYKFPLQAQHCGICHSEHLPAEFSILLLYLKLQKDLVIVPTLFWKIIKIFLFSLLL